MTAQLQLFDLIAQPVPVKQHLPRRVMAHVIDAGIDAILFGCSKCGWKSDLLTNDMTTTQGRRGIPCPRCNPQVKYHVVMFQPRFHSLVERRIKRQTIRPPRKREIRRGDLLSLRGWTGKPYRSKQRILLDETMCKSVEPICIDDNFYDNHQAQADGFACAADMRSWFDNTHGLPFTGILIKWD